MPTRDEQDRIYDDEATREGARLDVRGARQAASQRRKNIPIFIMAILSTIALLLFMLYLFHVMKTTFMFK